ncbi:MAG: DUF4333 domain-containing protein, partial [Sciscionella sp.]
GYPPQSYPQQQPAAPQQGYERAPQGYPGGYPQPGSGAFPAQAPGHGVGPVGYEQGYPGQQPGYPTQGYPTQGQQPGYPPQPASGSFPAQQPGYAQPGGYQQQYYGVEQPGGFQRPGPYGDPQRPVPGLDSLAVEPKRSKLPWILSGAVALIVIVVAILGFVAPGFFVTKTFDSTSLQNGVRNTLTNDYKIGGVGQVSCPSGQQVTVGATFTCTVSINGQQKTVTLRVQDSSGVYQVGQPN